MRYAPAGRLAWMTRGSGADELHYIAAIPDGRPHVLGHVAAEILRCTLEVGERDDVVAELAAAFGEDAEIIGPQIDRFLAELVEARLLIVHR